MSYTLKATVSTNPAMPATFDEASDAATVTDDTSNLTPKSLAEESGPQIALFVSPRLVLI